MNEKLSNKENNLSQQDDGQQGLNEMKRPMRFKKPLGAAAPNRTDIPNTRL